MTKNRFKEVPPLDKDKIVCYNKDVKGCGKLRYIGSKINLLDNIENFINQNIHTQQESFCDIFSGTGIVARHFKPLYRIISNDSLYFSYVIQKAFIENNKTPTFSRLKKTIENPLVYLENEETPRKHNFIEENYTPTGKAGRMYYTSENAQRID
ncbi:MAG: DNA adenine methylase, partial [Treponema sp.]|nr:DNA adenine methylase [Treponema sp.]